MIIEPDVRLSASPVLLRLGLVSPRIVSLLDSFVDLVDPLFNGIVTKLLLQIIGLPLLLLTAVGQPVYEVVLMLLRLLLLLMMMMLMLVMMVVVHQ